MFSKSGKRILKKALAGSERSASAPTPQVADQKVVPPEKLNRLVTSLGALTIGKE